MPALLNTAGQVVLDAIFPPRCAGCRGWDKALFCAACEMALRPIVAPFCSLCGTPFDPLALSAPVCVACRSHHSGKGPAYTMLRSVYTFEGPLREAVHSLKYRDKTALAGPLAALMQDFLERQTALTPHMPLDQLALVTAVPLHPWRRYRRGYNQSELLADELARTLRLPSGMLLRRIRHTTPQVELSAGERAANVQGAFEVDAAAIQSSNPARGPVLLIDDVCTTGATLGECAGVLRQAGVSEVYALTLARQL